MIVQKVVKSSLGIELKKKQMSDPILIKMEEDVGRKKVMAFEIGVYGILRYQRRLCVPNIDGLQCRIFVEAYGSRYMVHPGSIKMYNDLKEIYW